jgi:hypothetical protein
MTGAIDFAAGVAGLFIDDPQDARTFGIVDRWLCG